MGFKPIKTAGSAVRRAAKYYNDTKTVAAKEATAGGKATLSLGHTKLINKEVRAV